MTTPESTQGTASPQAEGTQQVPGQQQTQVNPNDIQLSQQGKQEPPKQPEVKDNTSVGEFGDAGDPALNVVYRFIENLGFKTSDSEIQSVIEKGDFSLLRAKLASMGDKATGWQEYLGIAENKYKQDKEKEKENTALCENAIHQAVGGKEQWLQIQSWASANADEHEKETFNALLSAGPLQAKVAARQLADYYYKANGVTKEPQSAVGDNATSSKQTSYALSPQEYTAAVQELARKVGAGRIDNHPDYEKLKQRRLAYRG